MIGQAFSRSRAALLLGVAAACLLPGQVFAHAGAGEANSTAFADPMNDSGSGPDLTTVTIANDDAGRLSVRVPLPAEFIPGANFLLTVAFDTDNNATTGDPQGRGSEYVALISAKGSGLVHWNGTTYEPLPAPSFSGLVSDIGGPQTSASFSMNASELGAVSSFHFWVLSDSDSQGNGATADYAPDTGTYAYALAGGAPTVSETPVIKRIAYPASLLYPRVGKLYSARQIKVGLSTGELVRPETLSCRLLVQHKLVRSLPGGCRWRIPTNLAGKSAVLKVDLTYRGAKATDSWHVMIRA